MNYEILGKIIFGIVIPWLFFMISVYIASATDSRSIKGVNLGLAITWLIVLGMNLYELM